MPVVASLSRPSSNLSPGKEHRQLAANPGLPTSYAQPWPSIDHESATSSATVSPRCSLGMTEASETDTAHACQPVPPFPSSRTRFPPAHDSQTAPASCRPKTKWQRKDDVLQRCPPKNHWLAPTTDQPLGRLRAALFHLLCVTSFGYWDMKQVWAGIKLAEEGDESVWEAGIRETVERLNNQMLVSGLLLAVAAAFLTTDPPQPSIMNWTLDTPYTFFLASFGMGIGCVVIASAMVLATSKTRADWAADVHYCNSFRLHCTLLMMAYPTFSIGISTVLLALGVASSLWGVEDSALSNGAVVVPFVIPVCVTVLVAISRVKWSTSKL